MFDPTIGARLRKARLARGCSGVELAEKLGVTPNYIWRIERADASDPKQLSIDKLRRACRILGVTSDWMLGITRAGGPK